MKRTALFFAVFGLMAASEAVSQGRGISPAVSRVLAVEKARAILEGRVSLSPGELRNLKDPFNPPETDLKDLIVSTSIRPKDTAPMVASDSDVLQMLSSMIAPTGIVAIGGEPFLLFGEKRLKTGDGYTISKDGVDYTVIIDSIESSRFSLRYNTQVIFRPIK